MGGGSILNGAGYWRADSVDREVEASVHRVATIRRSQRQSSKELRKPQRESENLELQMSGGLDAKLSNDVLQPVQSMSHPDDGIPKMLSRKKSYGFQADQASSADGFWTPKKKRIMLTVGCVLLGCVLFGAILGAVISYYAPADIDADPLYRNFTNDTQPNNSTDSLEVLLEDGITTTNSDDLQDNGPSTKNTLLESETNASSIDHTTLSSINVDLSTVKISRENDSYGLGAVQDLPPEIAAAAPKKSGDNEDIFVGSLQRSRKNEVNLQSGEEIGRFLECQFKCKDGSGCYPQHFRCDNAVQCKDASDELGCRCAERLEPWKLCDGFADCPDREDELGCNGCSKHQFSCSPYIGKGCYNVTQWCDGRNHCQNNQDEYDCIRLNTNEPYVSVGFGMIERNWNGKWYPVCIDREPTDGLVQHVQNYADQFCRTYNGADFKERPIVETPDTAGRLRFSENLLIKPQHSGKMYMFRLSNGNCKRVVTVKCPKSKCMDTAHDIANEIEDDNLPAAARIVGGRPASIGEWPWIVAIYRSGTHICGGVVLNEHWVLTAGHCFNREFNYFYEVQAGMVRRLSLSPIEQTRTVTSVVKHPGFDPTNLRNDIALAYVAKPFSLNKWVTPICLAEPGYNVSVGTICHVAGWGSINETGYFDEIRQADLLQEVSVPIVSECKNSYNDKDKEVCAGQQGKDSCQGDSGSPLLCPHSGNRNALRMNGLVSHGKGCARASSPGVYTKISAFRKWIDATISKDIGVLKDLGLAKTPGHTTCPGVTCPMGGGTCVMPKYVCDGYVDCSNALDETNCSTTNSTNIVSPTAVVSVTSVEKVRGSCSEGRRQCSESDQCVPEASWCDLRIDCSDRSDESECTCGHYLLRLDPTKFCDGFADCADFSDESACDFNCQSPKFFCHLSRTCFSNVTACNRIPECPYGEDELFCLALANPVEGRVDDLQIQLDEFGFPVRENSGFVSINSKEVWQQLCAFEVPNESLRNSTCKYLGLDPPVHWRKEDSLKNQLIARQPARGRVYSGSRSMKKLRSNYDPQKIGFLQTERRIDERFEESIPSLSGIQGRSVDSLSKPCGNLHLQCGEQTSGIRPLYKQAKAFPSVGRGLWPWHLMVYGDGVFICDATLLSPNSAYAPKLCVMELRKKSSHITLIAGAIRQTLFTSPFEQIRNVQRASDFNDGVILEVDTAFELTSDVNPIMLQARFRHSPTLNAQCVITKTNPATGVIHSHQMVPVLSPSCAGRHSINQCFTLKSDDLSDICEQWFQGGIVVCTEDSREWYASGIYKVDRSICRFNNTLVQLTSAAILKRAVEDFVKGNGEIVATNDCNTHRCDEGKCLTIGQLCDGKPDCRDASDEPFDCQQERYCKIENDTCACSSNEFRCGNGKCIPLSSVCDGKDDCPKEEDETSDICQNCSSLLKFKEPNKICDEVPDCADGSDEWNCKCDPDTFRCYNSTVSSRCLTYDLVCDGFDDCDNREDETNCVTIGTFPVKVDQFGQSKPANSGFLMGRIKGKWYTYCKNDWKHEQSLTICQGILELDETSFLQISANHTFVTPPVALGSCEKAVQISCNL